MQRYALAAVLIFAGGSIAHAQTLEQQERCAIQARRSFQELEAENRASQKQFGGSRFSSDYQSHYNTKIGKCLILVEATDNMLRGEILTTAYLMDANERRIYAAYGWSTQKGKKYWEVPPTTCELTPSLRDKKFCKTREEFDAFVAEYMEE